MSKRGDKKIAEATADDQKMLVSVVENEADIVTIRGREFKVKWLHPAIGDWISSLISKEGNDSEILAKCAALIRLNGFWKCHLLYWFVWRWYYYVRQYNASELMPLIETAQKKTAQVEAPAYLNATILLLALSTTRKQMTKEEAERIRQGLLTAKGGKSPKSTESTQDR